MDKLSKVLFIIWMVLAVASFVAAFFVPVFWVKAISVSFGIVNMAIVLSWISATIQAKKEYNKEKTKEE